MRAPQVLIAAAAIGLGASARAEPPEKVAATLAAGSLELTGLQVSASERLVLGADGSSVILLDSDSWETSSSSPCSVESATLVEQDSELYDVWVGCADGTVAVTGWSDGSLSSATAGDREIELGTGPILGIWFDGLATIYALEDADGLLTLHSLDIDSDAVDGVSGYPFQLSYDGFVDAVLSGDAIYVAHGGDDITRVTLGSAAGVINVTPLSVSLEDLSPSSTLGVYGADSGGYVVEYSSVGQWLTLFTDLDSPTAVASQVDDKQEWMLIPQAGLAEVYDVTDLFVDPDPIVSFELPAELSSVGDLITTEGWSYGAASDGSIAVFTANPWISGVEVSPSTVVAGETVSISFDVDVGGSWSVHEGGDRTGSGTELVSGELDIAGRVESSVTVGEDWPEGDNPLYLIHTDDLLRTGHALTSVLVDNPPDLPPIDSDSLGFADGALILEFEGVSDEDLDYYEVYITTTPFSASEWETGGPAFDGRDPIEAPVQVSAEGGQDVRVYLGPLSNGQTYYVAARAFDTGGQEGPMSKVVHETPRETYSASELSGEDNSLGCSVAGRGALGLGGLLVAAAAAARRRRSAAGAAAVLCLLATTDARAEPTDLTPAWGNFELRYGSMTFDDEAITRVYGTSGRPMLQLEVGPQLWRVVELDVGLALSQTVGNTVDEDGLVSAEISNLTVIPVSAALTGRLHLWDEQILVPYASYGLDYFIWRESWDDGYQNKETVTGAKWGNHRAVGLNIMLDVFAPSRASLLEAQTGINDTYLVLEWRETDNDSSGLSFSAEAVMIGLKLDY